jgi:hypothetical protein
VDDVEQLLAELSRWTSEARTDDAVLSRTRERAMRQLATDEARFTSLVLDMAERGEPVTVRTTTGRTHHGRLVAVATDLVALFTVQETTVLLTYDAIAGIRPAPGFRAAEATADRVPAFHARMSDVLAGLAADRPRVQLGLTGGGELIAGELRAVGTDVATVRIDADPPATLYVRLDAVAELTVLG